MRSYATRANLSRVGATLAFLAIAFLLLLVLREGLVLLFAGLLAAIARLGIAGDVARLFIASPVHAQLLVDTVGGINTFGLAVRGVAGSWLHSLSPTLFLDAQWVASGAWASAVVAQDSTILSLFLSQTLAQITLLVLGGLLTQRGLRRQRMIPLRQQGSALRLALALLGLVMLGQSLWGLMMLTVGPTAYKLDDMGIGIALSIMGRLDATQYDWLMSWFLPVVIPIALAGIGLAISWGVDRLIEWRLVRAKTRPLQEKGWSRRLSLGALWLVAIVLVGSATDYFGLARINLVSTKAPTAWVHDVDTGPAPVVPAGSDMPDPMDTPSAASASSSEQTPLTGGTPDPFEFAKGRLPSGQINASGNLSATLSISSTARMGIISSQGLYRLAVNGRPVTLIGMNYNVNYTALPAETKRKLHERDFRILRDAGVNAVIGWGVYDEVTLQVAQKYSIGVVMPFDLDPTGAFDNPRYRQSVKDAFRVFIDRYRASPGVLAWNPGGDELLHRMEIDQHRTGDKLQPAADFLIELSEMAYTLDPNHISIVKEPRDAYLPYFETSLKKVRGVAGHPNPANYLVYATNIYGRPDELALSLWNARQNVQNRLGVAILVGEYAPFGMARSDRPALYGAIWDICYRTTPNGAFAYVYGPDQPNPQAPNPYDPLRLLVN
ncbi:MAG: hypothetical protein WCF84_16040, partial [Anaerolineae bacterium]